MVQVNPLFPEDVRNVDAGTAGKRHQKKLRGFHAHAFVPGRRHDDGMTGAVGANELEILYPGNVNFAHKYPF
jgi:hypothetical protein